MRRVAVIAFGGNAILPADSSGTQKEQFDNAKKAVEKVSELAKRNFDLVIVHGNGPQVGNLLLQMDMASHVIPPFTIDVADAMTEGSMGYMLQIWLENYMRKLSLDKEVATVLTPVLVDPEDPAFENPTKPVGPFYTEERARKLAKEKGWKVVEDSGRGWRRVVPSPAPIDILNKRVIKDLVEDGIIVIAGGGGGIPVIINRDGLIEGVEAVIDKDLTAALIGRIIKADMLITLTAVDQVYINFGKPDQKALRKVTIEEMEKYLAEGQFPPGSMGPKIKAAIEFLKNGGKEVLITSAKKLKSALDGKAGTRIISGGKQWQRIYSQ